MLALVKKLHMYIGLLNFSNLIVFGIAGLAATFQGEGGWQPERLVTKASRGLPERLIDKSPILCSTIFIFPWPTLLATGPSTATRGKPAARILECEWHQ